jgi:hypothetical protein
MNVSFAIISIKTVQINEIYLPFRLLNASVTSFNYLKVMGERIVTASALTTANKVSWELFSPSPTRL